MRPFSLIFRFPGFVRSPEQSLNSSSRSAWPARICALSCLALFLAPAAPLSAETDIQFGPIALNGADGATGIPGQPGQDGGPGGSATATADAPNQENIAEATGARGGNGGAGGDATIGSGADGGQGGSGGNGGNAIARATTLAEDFARAVATGGSVGFAGSGGNGSSPGLDGASGEFSGLQGNATAQASIDRESIILGVSDGIQGDAIADGENAIATVSGIVGGAANPTASHRLEATATSFRGSATADAMGRTNHGAMVVRATADINGRGSETTTNASATATGTHSGAGSLEVSATSVIQRTSGGLLANVGHASASGIATGGADVTVGAAVVGGAGIELRSAVSGSTSGLLKLSQGAHTDTPLFFLPSANGIGGVRTDLIADNPGGGDLQIAVGATAPLIPLLGVPNNGDIIFGNIQGTSNSGANVTVSVHARGNRVLQQDLDDASLPSQIRGISNGGDVSISTDFSTGFRTSTFPVIVGTEVTGLDGPDIVIDEGVAGETTGNLEFIMQGRAGNGGSVNRSPGPPPGSTFRPGNGGSVTQRLTQSGSFASLSMDVTSTAGRGGANGVPSSDSPGGRGGSATTALDGTNDAGSVTLGGNALGSAGGFAVGRTGQGGDATIDFRAATSGDGHAILIGNETELEVEFSPLRIIRHGAHAGGAGEGVLVVGGEILTPTEFGDGGRAVSRSEGLAQGSSTVRVYDFAGGGSGGGDATSSARAEGGGVSAVLAQSKAAGGGGSSNGGDADSFAIARGLGESQASALAISGGSINRSGTAHAVAESAGASGNAMAEARTGAASPDEDSFRAMVSRSTSSQTRLEATAGNGLALPTPSTGNSGSAFMTGRPLAADVDQLVLSRNALGDLVGANPGVQVNAIGEWSARGDSTGTSTQLVELDITLATPEAGGDLALVISNLSATGGGFESLLFRLEILGSVFGEEITFNELADAVDFFSSIILLGETYSGIRAIFEVTTQSGQSVAFGLAAVVIPEPSTALLIGIGLMLVATSHTRKHETRAPRR